MEHYISKVKKQITYDVHLWGHYHKTEFHEGKPLKVMLYNETNGHCAYCNKPLNINDIFTDNIQVDHILPISKSFNDCIIPSVPFSISLFWSVSSILNINTPLLFSAAVLATNA